MFNYNGHTWDAYEALGIEPGASNDDVEDAYHRAIAELDPSSQVFVKTAYECIKKSRG